MAEFVTAREVGRMPGAFAVDEGWRRHLHLGLSARDDDPLAAAIPTRCHPRIT